MIFYIILCFLVSILVDQLIAWTCIFWCLSRGLVPGDAQRGKSGYRARIFQLDRMCPRDRRLPWAGWFDHFIIYVSVQGMKVRVIRALVKISDLIILVGQVVDISGKVFSPVLSTLFSGIDDMKKFDTR